MEKKTCTNPIFHLLFYLFILNIFYTRMAKAQIIPIRVGVVLDMDDYGKNAFIHLHTNGTLRLLYHK